MMPALLSERWKLNSITILKVLPKWVLKKGCLGKRFFFWKGYPSSKAFVFSNIDLTACQTQTASRAGEGEALGHVLGRGG